MDITTQKDIISNYGRTLLVLILDPAYGKNSSG